MQPKAQVKWCLGKWVGMKGKGWRARDPLAVENSQGRANGRGKWAEMVAGGKGGRVKGLCLNILDLLE